MLLLYRSSSLSAFIRDPGVAFVLALRANTWIPALKTLPEWRSSWRYRYNVNAFALPLVIPECLYKGSRCFFWPYWKPKANTWIPALKALPEWRSSGRCLLSFFALCFLLVIPECFYQGSRCFFWPYLKAAINTSIPALKAVAWMT